ncbi:hypothetical protein KEM52_004424, partial [Ascosphaera acerosa]
MDARVAKSTDTATTTAVVSHQQPQQQQQQQQQQQRQQQSQEPAPPQQHIHQPQHQQLFMPPPPPQQSKFSQVFTFIESHPTVPGILSYYAQFTFNATLALVALYVILSFLLAIRAEVNRASEEVSADILAEMATCARDYVENRCADHSGMPGRRLPALEAICDRWERCMNRDPAKVGRASVSARTLAEIFNGFIEPISYKAFFFATMTAACCLAVSNFTFSLFRNKVSSYEAYQTKPAHQQVPPPSQPPQQQQQQESP